MSTAIHPQPKRPLWRRTVLAAIMTPIVLATLFCASHAYSIYSRNRAANQYRFPATPPLTPGESLLIVSPHPDDETLGTAGLVQDALRTGIPVHVVFLTCGDAFHIGVASYYHELHVQPADYVRYGTMRQGEARSALGSLGLSPQDIVFLGYPDQGMMPIWRTHWNANDPYTSMYTKVARVPYPDAFHPGAPYSGQSVASDLETLIARYKPTDVYVTHPSDDHPDHAAASAFVNVALAQLALQGSDWASSVRVHYYLVHRGDWPVPQGLDVRQPLAPPSQMISLDTHWNTLNLLKAETLRKDVAITRYVSQEQMMQRFMTSFARTNELFGQIPGYDDDIPTVDDGQIVIDGNSREWPDVPPFDIDPVGDSVIRDFQTGADLRYVYLCADSHNLYVRVDTEQSLSPEIRYNLYIRGFDASSNSLDSDLTVSFSPRDLSPGQATTMSRGIRAAYDDSTLEMAIPLSDLGPKRPTTIYAEAATLFSRVTVDRTGIRCGHLLPPIHRSAVDPSG